MSKTKKSSWRREQPAGTKLYKKMLKNMFGTWKERYVNVVRRK